MNLAGPAGSSGYPLRISLLGPVRAWRDGREAGLGQPLRRALLAALAVHANRPLSRDELVAALWGQRPPDSARSALYTYVSGLRRALEPGRGPRGPWNAVVSADGGYLLRLGPGDLDTEIMARHLAEARELREANSLSQAITELEAALALFRGAALSGVPGPFAEAERIRLEEQRLTAIEDRADLLLRLGRHHEVVAGLAALVHEHPLRERARGLEMLALYRCGRQAEALEVFQHGRRILADELGVDPGTGLCQLHQRILTADPVLDRAADEAEAVFQGEDRTAGHSPENDPVIELSPAGVTGPPQHRYPRPAQLPPDVQGFTGRHTELARLRTVLPIGQAGQATSPVLISAIGGTAGIGKSALAVHFAHQAAGHFPGGQLYVNLRGFGPAGSPMTPGEALGHFLTALAVPAEGIPATVDGQAALYRSLLAGRRMLILLDNARDAAQVRPLLPGSRGCAVLITSRGGLTGLLAAQGASPVILDVLTGSESLDLLTKRLGPTRIAAERPVVDELIGLCARLPLALSVAAARAATRPHLPLATLVAELRDFAGRLDALDTGDAETGVRAVFSWSYRQLSGPAARMFRALSLHPGPDIPLAAAASMTGTRIDEARRALAELAQAHVVTEHAAGRFTFHDLLRTYAAEQARAGDSAADRRTAARRLLDHYLHTAFAGAVLINPTRRRPCLPPAADGVVPEHLTGYGQAMAWFETEHHVLLAAIAQAAGEGFDAHAWLLCWSTRSYLDISGHRHDLATTQRIALAAAQRLGNPEWQANAHLNLGLAGPAQQAEDHLMQALAGYEQLEDRSGQANVNLTLAARYEQEGRYMAALDRARHAYRLQVAAGDRRGQANGLNMVGWYHTLLGDHRQALAHCQDALRMYRELGDLHGEAATLDSVGHAHHGLGDPRAVTCYQQAADLLGQLGSRHTLAAVLYHLGDAHHDAGDHAEARHVWQRALDILDALHHPDAGQVRARLHRSAEPRDR